MRCIMLIDRKQLAGKRSTLTSNSIIRWLLVAAVCVSVVPGQTRPVGMRPLPSDPIDSVLDASRRQVVEALGGEGALSRYNAAPTELARTEIWFQLYSDYQNGPALDLFRSGSAVTDFVRRRINEVLNISQLPNDPMESALLYLKAVRNRAMESRDDLWPGSAIHAFGPGKTDPKFPYVGALDKLLPWVWQRIPTDTQANWVNIPLRPRSMAVQEAMIAFLNDMIASRSEWGRSDDQVRHAIGDLLYASFDYTTPKAIAKVVRALRNTVIEQTLNLKPKDYADNGADYERLLTFLALMERTAIDIDQRMTIPGSLGRQLKR